MASRPFFGARVETRFNKALNIVLRRRGWRESTIGYVGYGNSTFIRVLGRLVLRPSASHTQSTLLEQMLQRRGWRNFLTAPVPNGTAVITIDGQAHKVTVDRGGYFDVRVPNPGLEPGWHDVLIDSEEAEPTPAAVQIVADDQKIGIVSDIDDTIISTSLPRPLIAAWNTFVLEESARQAVAGMSEMYRRLVDRFPGAPVVYVSTGAWNTAPTLARFMSHHRYPRGAMLLTDWGPTNTGWFRSGQDHKRYCLDLLSADFPDITWVLIGDDGQHDPSLYSEFAKARPEHVRLIAIRQLSPGEQILAHGTPIARLDEDVTANDAYDIPMLGGIDGYALEPKVLARLG